MDQHLDTERLAAFADGSLSRRERAAVEAHAADCPRCLQLLAVMARTEPRAARTGSRLPGIVRWTVPFAAAATVVAVWVNVSRRSYVDEAPGAPATVEVPAVPETSGRGQPLPPLPAAPDSSSAGDRRVPDRAGPERAQPNSVGGVRAKPEEFKRERSAADRVVPEGAPSGRRMADSASKSVPELDPKREPAALAETRQAPRAPERSDAAARQEAATFQARKIDGFATARSAGQVSVVEVVSPDPLRRWRAIGTVVQHSTDGGKSWVSVTVPPHDGILAGASPSPTVSWLVGRAGTVLLTTDGTEWTRLDFPQAVDLTGVRVKSDREAEITALDGRVFLTSDGGRTWTVK